MVPICRLERLNERVFRYPRLEEKEPGHAIPNFGHLAKEDLEDSRILCSWKIALVHTEPT